MLCADPSCGCGIVSDSLTVTGSGAPGSPYRLETNAFSVVTSTTRPASPFTGQFIWETDKERQLVWTGTYWLIVAGAKPGWNLTRLTTDPTFAVEDAAITAIDLLNEVEDSDGFHTGINGFVTIPAGLGGDYIVTGGLRCVGDATGYRVLWVSLAANSAITKEVGQVTQYISGASGSNQWITASKKLRLGAGAQVTLNLYQTSGDDLDVNFASLTGAMTRHVPSLT